jgi:hypothetical protein
VLLVTAEEGELSVVAGSWAHAIHENIITADTTINTCKTRNFPSFIEFPSFAWSVVLGSEIYFFYLARAGNDLLFRTGG